MTTFKCREIHIGKPRVLIPGGLHGDVFRVGQSGITAIDYIDGAIVVTAANGQGESAFVLNDWLHAKLESPKPEAEVFRCEKCGCEFKNSQGLGAHLSMAHPHAENRGKPELQRSTR